MRRAQIALEFLLLSVLALVTMIVLLALFGRMFADKSREATLHVMDDLGRMIQEETILAATVHPGYARTILLPDRINNQPYTIVTTHSSVRLAIGSDTVTYVTPPLDGQFVKGKNLITNVNGTVEVHP